MKNNKQPAIIVIVGVSGDLSKRKLLPALNQIALAGVLPEKYKIVGITRRQDVLTSELLIKTKEPKVIADQLEIFAMDLLNSNDYQKLAIRLEELEKEFAAPAQRLFYLSVPPQISTSIISELGLAGLATVPDTKLLLEKPFGVDLASAQELTAEINLYFKAEQVYRIDHYLAKETAQNILVFRQNNSLFKRTWNKDFISKIDIIAQETIGIEGRAIFYEQTGALRDLVQSHLLQLAALVLMDLPDNDDLSVVPKKRLEALKNLALPSGEEISLNVKRGQYLNYQQEVGNIGSPVETFVALTLESQNPNWRGVPINLITGKALDSKFVGIKISYKKEKDYEANELILKLQPNEGVDLCLWSKKPGYDYQVDKHPLKFSFGEHYQTFPEAYEQVLYNAINSDHSLFASGEEVLESWRIIEPIQRNWQMSNNLPEIYEEGSSISMVLKDNNNYGQSC